MEYRIIIARSEVPGIEPPGAHMETVYSQDFRDDVTIYGAVISREDGTDLVMSFSDVGPIPELAAPNPAQEALIPEEEL